MQVASHFFLLLPGNRNIPLSRTQVSCGTWLTEPVANLFREIRFTSDWRANRYILPYICVSGQSSSVTCRCCQAELGKVCAIAMLRCCPNGLTREDSASSKYTTIVTLLYSMMCHRHSHRHCFVNTMWHLSLKIWKSGLRVSNKSTGVVHALPFAPLWKPKVSGCFVRIPTDACCSAAIGDEQQALAMLDEQAAHPNNQHTVTSAENPASQVASDTVSRKRVRFADTAPLSDSATAPPEDDDLTWTDAASLIATQGTNL